MSEDRDSEETAATLAAQLRVLLPRMAAAAQHQARHRPSKSGNYPVALVFDGHGNLMGDESGEPIVSLLPLDALGINDNGSVSYDLGEGVNQLRSPAEAAEFLGTSMSGYKRLRSAGLLASPMLVGERRVAHSVSQLLDCLARMNEPKSKKRKRA